MPHDMTVIKEIKVEVVDASNGGSFIVGESHFTLGALIGAHSGIMPLEIKKNN
jgi:hypothetical protein